MTCSPTGKTVEGLAQPTGFHAEWLGVGALSVLGVVVSGTGWLCRGVVLSVSR